MWFLLGCIVFALIFVVCKGFSGKISFGLIITSAVLSLGFLFEIAWLGWLLLAVETVMMVICVVKYNKQKKDAAKKLEQQKLEKANRIKAARQKQFYQNCIKSGVESLSTELQRQIAILLAKEYQIDEHDIEKVLKDQKELIEQENIARDNKKLEIVEKTKLEKYKRDAIEQQKMKTPYPYYGREKKTIVLEAKINTYKEKIMPLEQEIQDLINYGNDLASLKYLEKKKDWAIAGGIAEGIAGPAAGVAMALHTQEENKRIEEDNRKRITAAAQSYVDVQSVISDKHSELSDIKKVIKSYEDEISKINIKLVDKPTAINPIDMISLKNVEVSEHKLSVDIKLKKQAKIYDKVPAVMDGAFWAHIYQEGDYIGSVRVILPYDGIDTTTTKLEVQTSLGIEQCKKCYVEYEAEKLWLIEK